MEETVCTRGDSLITIDAPRTENTDRRFLAGHDARLYRRGVRTKEDIRRFLHTDLFLDKESILHVARRVLRCKIEHAIDMLVILHLRSLCYSKTDAGEDIDDLLANKGEGMARTERNRIGGASEV